MLACKCLVAIRLVGSSKAKRPNGLLALEKCVPRRQCHGETGHGGALADFDLPYANHETPIITPLQRANAIILFS